MDSLRFFTNTTTGSSVLHLAPLSESRPFPFYFIPGYYVFMVLSLLPAPSKRRSWISTSLMVVYLSYVMNLTNGLYGLDFHIYCMVAGQVFLHLSLLHWTVPERDYLPPKPVNFNSTWAKISWAAVVVSSPRGVGWSHEIKCIPAMRQKAASLTRFRYVVTSCLWLVYYWAILDVQFAWRSKIFRAWTPEAPIGVTDLSWKMQIAVTWAHAVSAFAGIALVYTVVAIPMVGLGLFRPVDFPGMNGDWSTAYTVRRLWGDVWHQSLRNIFTSAADTLLAALRIQPRTFASRYIRLFTAFILSALIHELASVLACRADCGELYFFISQAVIILIEDHVIDLGEYLLSGSSSSSPSAHDSTKTPAAKQSAQPAVQNRIPQPKTSPAWYWRTLGFAWVFVWFSYSLRLYIDKQVRQGMYVPEPGQKPVSGRWIK